MPRAIVLACVLASSSVAAAQPFPPRVAVSADGSFVVSSVSSTGISGQRFDPSGGPIGPFRVQDAVQPGANHSIAADADGDFVVAWFRTDNTVRGQRFDAAGGQRGGSFVVTRNGYYDTAAAMTANGSFVVA